MRQTNSDTTECQTLAYIATYAGEAMQHCHAAGLKAEDFYQPDAAHLFSAAMALNAQERLFACGDQWIHECQPEVKPERFVELTRFDSWDHGILSLAIPRACRELKRMSAARSLKRNVDSAREAVLSKDDDAIRAAISALSEAEIDSKPRATWEQTAKVEIERAKDIISGKEDVDVRSIPWPWIDINAAFKPFRRGELVVLAGFASFGKSSLLRQLLLGAATTEHNCVMVSMEVPAGDIFNLMASTHSRQAWSRLKGLHPKDQAEFLRSGEKVKTLGISVLDDAHSLDVIIAWIRSQHQRRFLDVIAIDYLGLVSDCEPQRGQTKAHAVGRVAGAFKRLASELGCVVLLAVQINRGPMTDGNRPPRLTDLKDSGDIEAHADRAILLHRPSTDAINNTEQNTHDRLEDRPRFYMQLFQEKGRNVGTGHADLWFNRVLASFEMIKR